MSKHFSVLAELLYAKKGDAGQGGTLNLHYVNLPLLLNCQISHSFDLVFGPELGFLLKSEYEFPDNSSLSATSQFRKIDIGLEIGIRCHISKKLGVEYRYSYGLIGIRKPVYYDGMATYEYDAKNNPHNMAVQVGFFYNFHI
jgi:hypothetical protein